MNIYNSVFEFIDALRKDQQIRVGFVDSDFSSGYFIRISSSFSRHGCVKDKLIMSIVFFWKDKKLK